MRISDDNMAARENMIKQTRRRLTEAKKSEMIARKKMLELIATKAMSMNDDTPIDQLNEMVNMITKLSTVQMNVMRTKASSESKPKKVREGGPSVEELQNELMPKEGE